MRGCVHIYNMMAMHEEAVALALQIDPELAMAEADKVEDDEDLRKKLWLMVAKHVIEQEKGTKGENIRKAIAFLKETYGLLKIEDILPFFPDFALIDDFKEAICSSLDDYNKQIEQLKQEMNDATHGADNIRNDISALAQRYVVVDRDEDCGSALAFCIVLQEVRVMLRTVRRRKILAIDGDYRMASGYTAVGTMAPFYAEYILDLHKQLTLLSGEVRRESNGGMTNEAITSVSPTDKLRSQLDDAVKLAI
ncbi:hypothetical protein F3Y22_tig00112354pilonHSYRG00099 [Hibiscus syriacus]|uniref:Uncharacterized protein n=1 Tax=Hibiscus syriacus TaxID=106335 RepID=A0A6A2X0J7_HIBSY|nr:hypothetical protein F3Y22_tig00112354pilonHSYRG00099 [Hibiscus syriacus]